MARRTKADAAMVVVLAIVSIASYIISSIANALSGLTGLVIDLKVPIIALVGILAGIPLGYLIYQSLYFKSKRFNEIKSSISKYINNCNELNHHIYELKVAHADIKSFDYGSGSMRDESRFNFKRDQWAKQVTNKFVHNCSATVCKNALDQPIKYLCKYFDLSINEASLSRIESTLNDFAAVEQGKYLLKNERDAVVGRIQTSIPWAINTFSKDRLIRELGFEDIDLSDLYFPVYSFQYVSPGGNSSMSCDIKLDIKNLDNLIAYMSESIRFLKSVAGQRALMTSVLREKIKTRDSFTCQICGLSTQDERNLLLEIDHIIPLSRGGITTETNLQTLCWKCNRSKGSKLTNQQLDPGAQGVENQEPEDSLAVI